MARRIYWRHCPGPDCEVHLSRIRLDYLARRIPRPRTPRSPSATTQPRVLDALRGCSLAHLINR